MLLVVIVACPGADRRPDLRRLTDGQVSCVGQRVGIFLDARSLAAAAAHHRPLGGHVCPLLSGNIIITGRREYCMRVV